MKVSINNLSAYAKRIKAGSPTPLPTDLINITLTREVAGWMLDDLAKRGRRLLQCVEDMKTKDAKRRKRETELNLLSQAVDAINDGLNNYNDEE